MELERILLEKGFKFYDDPIREGYTLRDASDGHPYSVKYKDFLYGIYGFGIIKRSLENGEIVFYGLSEIDNPFVITYITDWEGCKQEFGNMCKKLKREIEDKRNELKSAEEELSRMESDLNLFV